PAASPPPIDSVGVRLDGDRTAALRGRTLPVIARVVDGSTVVDLRTVEPDQDDALGAALREAA
ncbi:MAG: hypothetical protein AAGK32_19035, partial [Actinomycetota bacterium]